MNASANTARLAGIGIAEAAPVSEGTRLAQYNMLNEMPVAVFGIITLAYIVSSLFSLVH
jgi:hypothetical protein